MSDTLEHFLYPPLPAGVDAIRILSVEPGGFYKPLVCKLAPVAFTDKPKYIALSYTWRDPYADNTELPVSATDPIDSDKPTDFTKTLSKDWRSKSLYKVEDMQLGDKGPAEVSPGDLVKANVVLPASNKLPIISLNNQPFPVHRNLYLAILHLRSPTHSLALWADAVCINQTDREERNAQVAMMSFIYTRALKVVAWLGVKDYSNQFDTFQRMSIDWESGEVRRLGASLASPAILRYSSEPGPKTAARIVENPYWARLWIVQEICLPRVVVFVYGSRIWRYEDLLLWKILETVRSRPPLIPPIEIAEEVEHHRSGAILRLINTRNNRHADMMRLETLIELFSRNECTEARDRVYGLLGLANDVQTLSRTDSGVDPTVEHRPSFNIYNESDTRPKRGRGVFKVDYSLPLYNIWTDVVKFVYFRAKNIEQWCSEQTLGANYDLNLKPILEEERCISVVRSAGIIQAALGQQVEEEIAKAQISEKAVIRAVGYLSGQIVHLGPRYTSFIGSFRAQQDWLHCWENYYHDPIDFEILRRINERYSAEIVGYGENDLARVQEIRNRNVTARQIAEEVGLHPSHLSYTTRNEKAQEVNEQDELNEPRVFLGTEHLIGLVPSAARIGDFIMQFWNCNAAIVVRPTGDTSDSPLELVGRADVAEVIDRKSTSGIDQRAEKGILGIDKDTMDLGHVIGSAAACIDLDLPTLQMITASITT